MVERAGKINLLHRDVTMTDDATDANRNYICTHALSSPATLTFDLTPSSAYLYRSVSDNAQ